MYAGYLKRQAPAGCNTSVHCYNITNKVRNSKHSSYKRKRGAKGLQYYDCEDQVGSAIAAGKRQRKSQVHKLAAWNQILGSNVGERHVNQCHAKRCISTIINNSFFSKKLNNKNNNSFPLIKTLYTVLQSQSKNTQNNIT